MATEVGRALARVVFATFGWQALLLLASVAIVGTLWIARTGRSAFSALRADQASAALARAHARLILFALLSRWTTLAVRTAIVR